MDFYVLVEPPGKPDEAYSVYVPSMPGCFSAGDTLHEALVNAHEAIELQLEFLLDQGEPVPASDDESVLNELRADPEHRRFILSVVSVSPEVLDETVERINLSVPRRVLHRIDRAAEAAKQTRSAFLAEAGLRAAALAAA